MQAPLKARLHGVFHALCGATVVAVGFVAGLRELQFGAAGTHSILYAYVLLFPIGGHFLLEGIREAAGGPRPEGASGLS